MWTKVSEPTVTGKAVVEVKDGEVFFLREISLSDLPDKPGWWAFKGEYYGPSGKYDVCFVKKIEGKADNLFVIGFIDVRHNAVQVLHPLLVQNHFKGKWQQIDVFWEKKTGQDFFDEATGAQSTVTIDTAGSFYEEDEEEIRF